jgi:protein SCO1
MSKNRIFYIGFFAVLVIIFLAVLTIVIPGFSKPKVNPLGTVEPFAFTNQNGQTVTQDALKGKVAAVNYFFTTCKGICPRMNNNVKALYDEFKNEPDFIMLSHTSDPETDSAARLKRYTDSMQINTSKWVFLTGRKDSLYSMARHSYKIDDPGNNLSSNNDEFLHTQFIALVNKKGQVVSVYDGLKQSEIKQAAERVKTLLKD